MEIKLKLYKIKEKVKNKLALYRRDFVFLRQLNSGQAPVCISPLLNANSKPTVLNLNIIDSCNSKCTMCNIWKQDEALEITPEQLKDVLSNPLFSELQHVGVTGGEPTIRQDLPQVYEKIIEALPNIKGLSIITNAIVEADVKQRIFEVKQVCDSFGVPFSAMVSIDGLGKAHDNVRGTQGNFKTAISVFNYLRNDLNIPVSFGCTISKINVWDVDDFLFYVKAHNMYGRFRIAESINRLYNLDRGKVIRNFDEDETYNLLLFFEKLKHSFEKNTTYKRTYSSIQNILQGGDRLIGCPYHNNGVVLGSKGQLSYCAPKSKEIGNALIQDAQSIYVNQFEEKHRILKEHCNTCIHDYHAPITQQEIHLQSQEQFYARYLKIGQLHKIVTIARWIKKIPKKNTITRIFIFGWYGTETVGDKAILGGIVNYYKGLFGERVEFVIGSLYPFVTKRTCYELSIKATIISTKTFELLAYAKSSDIVVMGGGPLMDLNELYIPLLGFKVAKAYNNKTVVFGCGIGPLKYQKFENAVKQILKYSDEIKLRDLKSVEIAKSYGVTKTIECFGDPAKVYLQSIKSTLSVKQENTLTCYLRDWTFEYFNGSKNEFAVAKKQFEQGLAHLIKTHADRMQVDRIEFHHMHNFVIGNDDRDFSRYFIETYFMDDHRVTFNKKLSTVKSISESMLKSRLNICMRFHSVLFAHTLDTNFIAVDYTLGGKIYNYLRDNNCLDNLKNIEDLIEHK
ncbi:polysaccharide pyruvyl transferase family protein [Aestuariibaculum sp. M13]|uniref:polysaccharide pyruvyl transferase family protein n=1 Tax=Aestuariibaculum sp. M13 TaxID=2967132 RepID=UPI002159E13C|nr:polysaccharide pyruvyl transferase family protein [Aestuariibaculum sp. M13]MCR8666369.1 polysaccharide pyruvyl transferase family protein [Aestuariibaculum sp. M13]